ncbi:uncharacterized protein LOC127736725 [Mytilus californianus]|uniref:uncharacterized protein LOC127736725 n=1 Tax=Mytilus californianus TaxID=6549 RepID=UPI0022456BE3|nr:uncharacterized protein LOC127736725 [Mytilus californianus]
MASNEPQNLLEWQLHCVLKRASLLQYYESFIKHGECDVLQLSKAEDGKFKNVMEKVGMARKSIHVRQFKSTLLQWAKDPGKDKHVPSYIQKSDDSTTSPAQRSLKPGTVSFPMTGKSTEVPQLNKSTQEIKTKEKEELTSYKSEKKKYHTKEDTTQKYTQSVVKDHGHHGHHGLTGYYDDLLDNTVLDKMVLDNLISRCILMIEDREEIIKPTTQRERNKVLLDILTDRPYPTFHLFKDVLQESEPNNSCIQELVKRMLSTESRDEHISCQGHEIMLNKHKVKLQKNYMMFVHGVDSKTDIADHLYQSDVLSTEEKEEICNSSLTQHESNRLLYNKLIRKGGDAYKHLLEAVKHGKYHDVASEMEKTELSDQEIQLCQIGMEKLKNRHEKKDILMVPDEVIPKHILEQFEKRLEQWKKDDQQFVSTEAEKHVMQKVLTQSSVTLVGNSGTGKSFLSKHIALIMMKHGYTVIPCSKPKDIGKWFKHGRKTLFVFDDVCGRYTLNQQIYTDWKQRLDHIISLLEDKCCKIISTCRLEVYKDEVFSNLSIFKMCNIDLSSQEFKLSAAEKFALAEVYFKENTDEVKEWSDKYDFFPLLCSLYHKQNLQKNVSITSFFSNPFEVFKDQVVQMYGESDAGKMQYCSLVLCVMFNNTLTEENLSPKEKKIGAVLDDLLEECELNKGTSIKRLKKSLETLEGTYVVKEDNKYKIIHDKLFDFLAKYFGEKLLQIFIDHANTDFIRERFLWQITDNMGTEIEFVIRIPDTYINRYIDRLLKDWENGFVCNVSDNRNMKSTIFTENFITRLNQLDLSKQEELVCTKDINNKDIALSGSCYMGTVDLVKWLISRNTNINYCREDGWFPLLWASQEGHVDVVKELLQHSADVNKCNNNDASPLYIASQNGHVDGVKVLLHHSADVNKCNNNDASPLYIASHNGHVNVVIELLHHSADVNKCNNNDASPLYIASQNGHANVVKVLLQHSADVNKCSNDGTPPLQIACYNNRIEVVYVLLQCDDVDINLCNDDGCSSLYWASENGHVNVVIELLQHSADVNKCINNGVSPLYIASENGHVDVVKELLPYSADVNKCNNNGVSPLSIASQNGHVDLVIELLQHSADVNKCNNDGVSPLSIASQNGHVDLVIELLQHSADVNKCNNDGVSPLSIASQNGHVDVVKELLQHSADVNKCSNDGHPPLQIACYNNWKEVVHVLLQCDDVDINLCDDDGCSSLYWASQKGHVNVVKELLQHSADVNKCSNDGTPPLQIACYNNKIEVVHVLLQCDDVDINLCDEDGRSSLYIASEKGHVNVVKELLQHSADVNKCNNNDASPLYIASQNGHVDLVIELLQHSADVNKCNNDGVSPLSIASQNGHVDVVKELLQHSADVNKCNNNGVSPLYIASQNGHVNVVKELLQHSADVNKCSNDGHPPLQIACYNNKIEVVRVLLQCDDVDIDLCDDDGCSSLYMASQKGHVNVVKVLIQHSADVNKCNNKGKNSLNVAQEQGHIEIEQLLKGKGIDQHLCQNDQ